MLVTELIPVILVIDVQPLNVLAGPDGIIITDSDGNALLVE